MPATKPGPKPRLTRDQIVDESLAILRRDGPDGLSMRRLAARLGVAHRAVYGYFATKRALEEAIAARVMPAPPDAGVPGLAWDDELRRYAIEILDAFAAQPGAAPFLHHESTRSIAMDRVREHLLALLVRGGLSTPDAVLAVGTLSRYLMGCVLVDLDRREHDVAAETERLRALPADEFPTLRDAASAYGRRGSSDSMRFGLDLIIAGLRRFADSGGEAA